jgi:hypothetical protein
MFFLHLIKRRINEPRFINFGIRSGKRNRCVCRFFCSDTCRNLPGCWLDNVRAQRKIEMKITARVLKVDHYNTKNNEKRYTAICLDDDQEFQMCDTFEYGLSVEDTEKHKVLELKGKLLTIGVDRLTSFGGRMRMSGSIISAK